MIGTLLVKVLQYIISGMVLVLPIAFIGECNNSKLIGNELVGLTFIVVAGLVSENIGYLLLKTKQKNVWREEKRKYTKDDNNRDVYEKACEYMISPDELESHVTQVVRIGGETKTSEDAISSRDYMKLMRSVTASFIILFVAGMIWIFCMLFMIDFNGGKVDIRPFILILYSWIGFISYKSYYMWIKRIFKISLQTYKHHYNKNESVKSKGYKYTHVSYEYI